MSQLGQASADSVAFDLSEVECAKIWTVIAAYNEGSKIAEVVAELRTRLPHVVVVDDGSADATSDNALGAGAIVLRHGVNRGQGAALQTGISYALGQGAEIVVTYDADGQHRMSDIPEMVRPILAGEADICLGSRFLEHAGQVPWRRRVVLRLGRWFTVITSGMRLSDTHNGFRALSRRAAQQIDIRLDRMAHASEIIDQIRRTGLVYREVSVQIRYTDYSRQKGQRSSAAFKIALDYLVQRLLK